MDALKRIALAQLPVHVGDIAGNVERLLAARDAARRAGASLLLGPELGLLGYPPDDLLQRRGLPARVDAALAELQQASDELALVVGFPEFADGALFNAAAVFRNGQRIAHYRKQRLPNYGVFDEYRHFTPGHAPGIFALDGRNYALSICEDLWSPEVAAQARAGGADILLNLNASPYDQHKRAQRREIIAARTRETGLAIAYANAVGGQDDVVFDGDSQLWTGDGHRRYQAPAWQAGVFGMDAPACALPEDDLAQLYAALVTGTRDYVDRNGFARAYIGLSGGIDSAVTLAVAVDALGADRVKAVAMPSRYSAAISKDDALEQARTMGVECHSIPIEPAMQAYAAMLAEPFAGLPPDTAEENLQARIRGALLMALANKFSAVVLTTGNKSEMAVGYCTLYGDMCGGYAPLKDVYKMQVYALAKWRNRDRVVIPERVITRPPSAELRPDQRDDQSLPPYERLDAILTAYIEDEASIPQLYAQGFPQDEVDQIVRLVRLNEYKRRQSAPGPKVSRCAFGRERRYPLTARYENL